MIHPRLGDLKLDSVDKMSDAAKETKKGSGAGEPVDHDASREELAERAKKGETVIQGGTGGKTLEAQENLAKGRSKGGQSEGTPTGK